ncbi:MAG: dephospho-CoA kinase [Synergistales bacterium]|nr:dephospho-CoA kinase [Synergistales bacterium]
MWVIGLTGDIGAGKSTATRIFDAMGAAVIDADAVVRELWRSPEMIEAARSRWGEDVIDGEGRFVAAAAAVKAFASEEEYRWLCGLIHPLVFREIGRRLAALSGWVVVEIPLLFEAGIPSWVDEILYVTAGAEARGRRNSGRRLDGKAIGERERWLLPSEEKRRLSHFVVDNDGSLESFSDAVSALGRDFADLGGMGRFEAVSEAPEALKEALIARRLAALPESRPLSGEGGAVLRSELRFFGLARRFPDVERLCRSFGVMSLLFEEPRRFSHCLARRALEALAR